MLAGPAGVHWGMPRGRGAASPRVTRWRVGGASATGTLIRAQLANWRQRGLCGQSPPARPGIGRGILQRVTRATAGEPQVPAETAMRGGATGRLRGPVRVLLVFDRQVLARVVAL